VEDMFRDPWTVEARGGEGWQLRPGPRSGLVGHPKAFFGIKARPRAIHMIRSKDLAVAREVAG
jgi:hypothetical protein